MTHVQRAEEAIRMTRTTVERVARLRNQALAHFTQGLTNEEDVKTAHDVCMEVGTIVYGEVLVVGFDIDSTLYLFTSGPNDERMEVRYL